MKYFKLLWALECFMSVHFVVNALNWALFLKIGWAILNGLEL